MVIQRVYRKDLLSLYVGNTKDSGNLIISVLELALVEQNLDVRVVDDGFLDNRRVYHVIQFLGHHACDAMELSHRLRVEFYSNNFYEFGLDKADPAANAGSLKTDPWTLKISGEVAKPLTLDHDDLTRRFPLEERIYRMRCVEAWSMVVPWIGFPLHKLLALAEPTSNAKYVAFETIYAPEQMPGQQDRFIGGGLKYPYVEGLRLDEAMHPLTLMTVGVYGKALPPQNGAPVRLIVPWKYGFKGIKSIVSIKLTSERPPTTWNLAAPDEYGFYANVNPHVDHPRWSRILLIDQVVHVWLGGLHMAPFFTFISVRFNAGQITSPRILEWLKLPHPW